MPSFRAQSRNPPCTLFFLAPFAEGFQFYFVTHTTLYRCARKIKGFARDDVAWMAFSKHIRCTLREINPFPPYRHFERSEKSSLHSALSCSFRKSFPLFRCHTYDAISVCKKDPSASLGMTLRKLRFPNISFIRDVGYPSPIPSFRAQSRNPPCTLFFLAPFAEGFQFYFVTHTTLYRCARKIKGFARDDVAWMAFSKHIRCTLREINPFPPYRHFERSEKSSLHSALSCSFRKTFPLFRYHTYDIIPSCKKDSSASLGMTIQE